MTVIARWDPFREFTTLQDRMNRLFRDSFGSEGRDEALTTTGFAPPADVYEDEHSITVKIEVPGIEEKDIDVRIENNTLTVHGERKIEKEEKEENYLRVERSYGSFARSFALPNTVDASTVTADYDKGVLEITLAKRAILGDTLRNQAIALINATEPYFRNRSNDARGSPESFQCSRAGRASVSVNVSCGVVVG